VKIAPRPYRGASDLHRIAELVYAFPDRQRHSVDLPYRLSSWALETLDNTRLWEDEGGQLAGFAIVQGPWSTLDYGLGAEAREAGIEREIIAWGMERAQTIADRRRKPFTLFVEAREGDEERAALAEAHGFEGGAYEVLHLECVLTPDFPPHPNPLPGGEREQTPLSLSGRGAGGEGLPGGFTIRPLRGDAECQAYVDLHRAAFGTTNMTLEWRQRTLLMPQYVPEIDLVIEAPGGRLAAFCINWLSPDRAAGHVEPLGVHPDFHRLGLGSAILNESLRRMAAHGAQTAIVETYGLNDAAHALYESVGFRVRHRYQAYSRTFTPVRERGE